MNSPFFEPSELPISVIKCAFDKSDKDCRSFVQGFMNNFVQKWVSFDVHDV